MSSNAGAEARLRPRFTELADGDAVGVYGATDVLGGLNLQAPEAVLRATRSVMSGQVFSLNHPVTWPSPPLYSRRAASHTVFRTKKGNLDDWLDNFYPQASSQWDGFLHVADPDTGHYNHRALAELGIESWAERGIAGRGVLLDVARYSASTGSRPLDWTSSRQITVAELEKCRKAAGVEKLVGDILLIRTGWESGYREASEEHRLAMAGAAGPWPGLDASDAMAEYLWDWGVSCVAADNPSLEASPNRGDRLHAKILARLGIPIGELWKLDPLAEACDRDRRYECLVTSAPLHVVGGVGSPANAVAIR